MSSELQIVHEWFKWKKLSLNLSKTNYVIFGTSAKVSHSPTLPVIQGCEEIALGWEFKYWGVKLDPGLQFHNHAKYIQSKTIGKMRPKRITTYPEYMRLPKLTPTDNIHRITGIPYLKQKRWQHSATEVYEAVNKIHTPLTNK